MIKSVLGLMQPDEGSIIIDGQETTKLKPRERDELMQKFGMLFQGGALFDSLKVWENVAFGLVQGRGMDKRQAREIVAEEAQRAGVPYVDERWLGGMLTNFKTLKLSVKRLKDLEQLVEDGSMERMPKKEALVLQRELIKLQKSIGGIKNMNGLPDALFVIDVGFHKIAITEANKLGIPVIAVVDTNHSPLGVDYVIPGNDDSSRAIRLYASGVADAILEGRSSAAQDLVAQLKGDDEFVEVEAEAEPQA